MTTKYAMLGTSHARAVTWENGEATSFSASPRLLQLLEEGVEVFIVSTWGRFFKEGCDRCLFELVPEENFLCADERLDCGDAASEGMLDVWRRALDKVSLSCPEAETWLELRHFAEKAGVIIH